MCSHFCRVAALLGVVLTSGIADAVAQPLLARPAGLLARIDGVLRPLDIQRADIRVEIEGGQALTTTTLVFGNPYDRELEGDMVFPVPPGATLSGFGLDVDGQIVDAVAVERQAARAAYGVQVERKIDPALLEWVRGNVFRTRVFPIPARGERSVRVRYVSELTISEDRGHPAAVLRIPTGHLQAARRAELEIDAPDNGTPSEPSGLIRFEPRSGRQVARVSLDGRDLPDDLSVSVPISSSTTAVTGVRPDGRGYFLIDDHLVPPETVTNEQPRRVGLVWDASLSRATADTAREVVLVEQWVRQLGDVDVELFVIREISEPARRFEIRNQDASRLVAALRTISYDGGTRLDLLPLCPGCGYQVLFTDGQSLFDELLPRLRGMPPLYVVASGPPSRHGLLKEMARATGGSYVELSAAADHEILSNLGRRRFSLLNVRAESGRIADVVVPDRDVSSGRVSVSGRLLTPSARVILEYGWRSPHIVMRRTVSLMPGSTSELAALTWAERMSTVLSLLPEKNHSELLRLGLSFNLATPATSLLVLENVRQHLTNGIEPPRSRPALYAEYRRLGDDWHAWRKHSNECRQFERVNKLAAGWRDHILETSGTDPASLTPTPERPRRLGRGTGTIRGRVTAENDEALPGANIEIADACTHASRHVTAGEDGRYDARGLPEGNYIVRAQLGGFDYVPREMPLRPHQQTTIDLRLLVPCICERVFVSDYDDPARAAEQDDERPDATAELTQWDPDTPYLTKISEASPRDRYRAYLGQRTKYSRSPAFYLDLADFFLSHGDRVLGRRLLTNVVELDPDDVHLLRVAAHRLQSSGELQLATMLFEKVRSLLRFDLQARRDLALALTELADRRRAKIGRFDSVVIADYQRAMRLHREILTGRWDGWFNQSHILALTDLNRIIAMLRENGIAAGREFQLDPRLVRPIDADLRVVLTWDDDAVDLNLIIQKPNGEGSSPIFDARTGGVHVDSSGYGPAEYVERKALKGRYEIDVIYVDTSGRALLGPTTARATIFTNFGRPAERSRQVKVRLVNERDDYVLGTVRQ